MAGYHSDHGAQAISHVENRCRRRRPKIISLVAGNGGENRYEVN
jgi:hypothetical protein